MYFNQNFCKKNIQDILCKRFNTALIILYDHHCFILNIILR